MDVLPEVLDLDETEQLASRWKSRTESWVADASAISRIGAPGVQLLIACGDQLRLVAPSEALRDACAVLGVSEWLSMIEVEHDETGDHGR